MSIDTFFVRDVTILTAGTVTDAYGDTATSWATPTSVAVKGWLAQLEETEPSGPGRALVTVVRDVLRLPIGTPITAGNRVVIDGITYDVDGPPRRVWTPRGAHHLRVNLRAVEG